MKALIYLFALLVAPAWAATATDPEQALLAAINDQRAHHQLPPLASRPELGRLARDHSHHQLAAGRLTHHDAQGLGPAQRLRAAGVAYRKVGENVAMNHNVADPVAAAVAGWMDSPGHRANILDPDFSLTGIGIARSGDDYYFTQLFLAPAAP